MKAGQKGFTLSAVTLCLALAGCGGSNPAPGTLDAPNTVSGLAGAEGAMSAVSLRDSSVPPQERTITADGDGAFSFDVTGLTPPYVLETVDAAGTGESALAMRAGVTNINALTTAARACASRSGGGDGHGDKGDSHGDRGDSHGDRAEDHHGGASGNVNWDSDRYESVLKSLRTVLAPLFDHYGVKTGGDDQAESRAFRAMLKEVSFTVASGTLTVTNKATGAVIYSAPLSDVASGVLHPENIPGGGVTPPASCTYTYGAWGACQSSGTHTRAVTASTPAGCTGTPVVNESCVYTPPVVDGAALYTQKCAGCHGPLATSTKIGRTAAQITAANMTQGLSAAEVQAVATVLASSTPPACTYTTGAWGACQSNSTQTRTVTAAPAGCTGTPPASSQSCTYVPPVVTCTGFTYNAWTPGICPSSGQQNRTVAISTPAGCTGGSPVLAQACTYVPPVTTCTSFSYSAWGTCSASGTQSRTVTSSAPAGCTGGTPVLSQPCTPPPVACTTFTYSAWAPAICPVSGGQTRTVATSAPAGCTGGTPVVAQSCTFVPPPPDGAALYAAKCAGCHGPLATSTKGGRTAAQITAASMTQGLSAAEVQAVAAALATVAPPIDGAALYTANCAGCHGTSKKGKSAGAIQSAINSNTGGMSFLSSLTPAQIAAISAAQ
jgi:mono/diheme cytochrome c family protein